MKNIYKKYGLILLFLLSFLSFLRAQEGKPDGFMNSSGTSSTSVTGLISSIGEPVIDLLKDNPMHCSQGFIYKTVSDTVNLRIWKAPGSLKIYPNPAVDNLNIEITGTNFSELRYSIFGLDRRLISTGSLYSPITRLDVSNLIASSYMLVIENPSSNTVFYRTKFLKIVN